MLLRKGRRPFASRFSRSNFRRSAMSVVSILPAAAALKRARSALEARGISPADLRTSLLSSDFLFIPSLLRRFGGTGTDDPRHLRIFRRPIGPGNDEDYV